MEPTWLLSTFCLVLGKIPTNKILLKNQQPAAVAIAVSPSSHAKVHQLAVKQLQRLWSTSTLGPGALGALPNNTHSREKLLHMEKEQLSELLELLEPAAQPVTSRKGSAGHQLRRRTSS